MDGIPVVLGTASFGTATAPEISCEILDRYVELGGRVIDTANNYAFWRGVGGESESVIGDWLARNDRDRYTVMTKIGSQPMDVTASPHRLEGLSARAVPDAVDRSLNRLQTDHIDILLAHHDDPDTPLLETWQAFSELVTGGRVRQIGVSNYAPQRIAELAQIVTAHALAPLDFLQLQYSVLEPVEGTDLGVLVRLDADMRDMVARLLPQATIFAYSPLLGGRIFDRGADEAWPAEYDSPANRTAVEGIRRRARDLGVSASALVLDGIAQEGLWPVTATGRAARLDDNLALFTGPPT